MCAEVLLEAAMVARHNMRFTCACQQEERGVAKNFVMVSRGNSRRGITLTAIRRLARRGGLERLSNMMCEEACGVQKVRVCEQQQWQLPPCLGTNSLNRKRDFLCKHHMMYTGWCSDGCWLMHLAAHALHSLSRVVPSQSTQAANVFEK